MTDTINDIDRGAFATGEECLSGDPYCAKNNPGGYEGYIGSLCGPCATCRRCKGSYDDQNLDADGVCGTCGDDLWDADKEQRFADSESA